MLEDVTYLPATGPQFLDVLDEVIDLYLDVRRGLGDNSSINSRAAFVDRTTRQAGQDGFGGVLARVGGTLVGFAFGVPLPPGGWWGGRAEPPPMEILAAPKFAVIEIDVAEPWRGRGIGRALHDRLLADRPEPYAILTTAPGRPARAMYARWGWVPVGTAQHAPDAPVMDELILRLHG
jgi:GNAT superfamily N-acetyltransferase